MEDPDTLRELFRHRQVLVRTEPPEVVARRLDAARVELAAETEFDVTLVNTSVEDVCSQLVSLMVV